MSVLDLQNYLSNPNSGDSPTLVADNVSAQYIDQQPGYGMNFFAPGGGAYVAPWVMCQVTTAFTSGGSGTLIAVLQDAPDPSTTFVASGPTTWTDRIVGATFTVGGTTAPSANALLLAQRILPSMARYLRVVYRIGSNAMTAGTLMAWLMPDQDVIDTSMRKVGTFVTQTGLIQENQPMGILND